MSNLLIENLDSDMQAGIVNLSIDEQKNTLGGKPGDITVVLVDWGSDGTIDEIWVIQEL